MTIISVNMSDNLDKMKKYRKTEKLCVEFLTNCNDSCNQINSIRRQILKKVYNEYLKENIDEDYQEFEKQIIRCRRPVVSRNQDNYYGKKEDRCLFICMKKNKLQQCCKKKSNGNDYCAIHIDRENIYQSDYDYPSSSEEDL